MGNTYILDEICTQEYMYAETPQCADNVAVYPIVDDPVLTEEVSTNKPRGVRDFVQQKISRIRSGIRHFCAKFSEKIKGVLLQN